MSTTTGKFEKPIVQESLRAVRSFNSQQAKIKKFLLDNANIKKSQRRAVMQLIQHFREVNNIEQTTQCTQMENEASTAHNEQNCSELTNTHGRCENVTKNPKRKRSKKKNEPHITNLTHNNTNTNEITTKKLTTEFIPSESKDSTVPTLERTVSLIKHVELEEDVNKLTTIITTREHKIRYLEQNLVNSKDQLAKTTASIAELQLDNQKLKTTTTTPRYNFSKENEYLKERLANHERHNKSQLETTRLNSEHQEIARRSIRVLRHQAFVSLKATHKKERGLFQKEDKHKEYESILYQFRNSSLQDKIVEKAKRKMYYHFGGKAFGDIHQNQIKMNSYIPLIAKIIEDREVLNQDLHVFSLL